MKTILYIGKFNGIIGGIERYMQQSAMLLRQNGFAVHYRYFEPGGKDHAAFEAAFSGVGFFSPEDELLKSADLVILHNIIDVKFLRYLPEGKTFFFAHDHNIYCQRHHYYTPIGRINCRRKYNKYLCRLCSMGRNPVPPLAEYRRLPALVLSEFMRENLHKNGFAKVFKLPAFINTAESRRCFMPDGTLRILFLGQLIRGKGADLLLKTLSRLTIPFYCTVAGDGNDRKMLESMVKKFQLTEKIRFTGFVSEPETLWKNCDVFVFPIRWQEPFGLVGLEAMAHGVPVLAFDLGGVREWLEDGRSGAAIAPKDFNAAADTLTFWAKDPEIMNRMGKYARKAAEEKFSPGNFIAQFRKLPEEEI